MQHFHLYLIEEVLEPLTHRFQRLTGKDCFWAAHAAFLLAVPGSLVTAYAEWHLSGYVTFPFGSMIICSYFTLLYFFSVRRRIETARLRAYQALSQGLGNPFKAGILYGNASFGLSLTVFYAVVFAAGGIVITVHSGITTASLLLWLASLIFALTLLRMYLIACDPLPPANSKIGEWLARVRKKVEGVLTPSPQPQPGT